MLRKIDADKDLWASGFTYVLVDLWINQIATRKLNYLLQIDLYAEFISPFCTDKDLWASWFTCVLVELWIYWINQIATQKLSSLLQNKSGGWFLCLFLFKSSNNEIPIIRNIPSRLFITTPQLKWSTRFALIRWIASIFDFNAPWFLLDSGVRIDPVIRSRNRVTGQE